MIQVIPWRENGATKVPRLAGAGESLYDLAVLALVLGMGQPTVLDLFSAYEAKTVETIPERFLYARRVAAALCASMFVNLARCKLAR